MPSLKPVIVIPVLNEAAHIATVLDGLLAENFQVPIWVYDGGSSDRTRGIVEEYASDNAQISLFHNAEKLQACAVNLAASKAVGAGFNTLIRLDAHATYSHGFVQKLLQTLDETGAESVVVPLITVGGNDWQNAAADLQTSWLGNGGARHRGTAQGGWVDHGHHAAFRLEAFVRVGGYDTSFVANEDVEFDIRLAASSGRIFLARQLPVSYIPRPSLRSTWTQMLRNGRFRARTAAKHQQGLGLRQLLPFFATISVFGSLLAGVLVSAAALGVAALYGSLVFALSLKAGRGNWRNVLRIWCLAIASHLGFGTGVLIGSIVQSAAAPPQRRALGQTVS